MARTSTGEMRALVARSGAAELTTLPFPALRDGFVLVRVTHALVTPFERESLRGGGFGREVRLDQRVDLHGPRMRLCSLGLSVHR